MEENAFHRKLYFYRNQDITSMVGFLQQQLTIYNVNINNLPFSALMNIILIELDECILRHCSIYLELGFSVSLKISSTNYAFYISVLLTIMQNSLGIWYLFVLGSCDIFIYLKIRHTQESDIFFNLFNYVTNYTHIWL